LLPLLRQHYQPRLSERVLRLMDLAGAEAEVVTALAERWLAAQRRVQFDRLAVAVQRRIVHLQLARMGLTPDFDLVERLRTPGELPVSVGAKRWVARDAAGLLSDRKSETLEFDSARLTMSMTRRKGQVEFGGLAVKWEVLKTLGSGLKPKPNVEYFDAGKIGRKVCLRHWQPGDRFQPIGMKSAQKLQDLFVDSKVPRDQRHQRVVAATQKGELFWVEGLRMADGFKLEPTTRRRLKWQWHRAQL
jgi:tRNA(Ile)-lysidine synthetase-like protein